MKQYNFSALKDQFSSNFLEENDPYLLPLFNAVLDEAHKKSGTSKKPLEPLKNNEGEPTEKWGFDLLYEHVNELSPNEKGLFEDILKDCKANFKTWKDSNGSSKPVSRDLLETVFCASAQARAKNIKIFLALYLRFCEKQEIKIRAAEGREPEIKKLYRECGIIKTYANGFDRFDKLIERHCGSDYFERFYGYESIEKFINFSSYNSGFYFIEGEPKTGKTSFLAGCIRRFIDPEKSEISKRLSVVWHFNSLSNQRNTVFDFIDSLFTQLSDLFDIEIFRSRFDSIMATRNNYQGFISDIITFISKEFLTDQSLVIFIDAFDETDYEDPTRRTRIGNILDMPPDLPENVYVVVSSRSFRDQLYNSKNGTDYRCVTWGKKSPAQQEDVQDYIKHRFSQEPEIKKQVLKELRYDTEVMTIEIPPEEYEMALRSPDTPKARISQDDLDKAAKYIAERCDYSFLHVDVFFEYFFGGYEGLPAKTYDYYLSEYKRLLLGDPEYEFTKMKMLAMISLFDIDISIHRLEKLSSLPHEKILRIMQDWSDQGLFATGTIKDTYFIFSLDHGFRNFLKSDEHSEAARELSLFRKKTGFLAEVINDLLSEFECQDGEIAYKRPTVPEIIKKETFILSFMALELAESYAKLSELMVHGEFFLAVSGAHHDPAIPANNYLLSRLSYYRQALLDDGQDEKAKELVQDFRDNIIAGDSPVITEEEALKYLEHVDRDFANEYCLLLA